MTTDTPSAEALAERLRYWSHNGISPMAHDARECGLKAAAMLRSLASERDALRADNANLRTVMVAAAEEIHAHWGAHCDAEGYGPANLMHRLEQGIPAQYGYTAGRFAELVAERDALRATLDAEREACAKLCDERAAYYDAGDDDRPDSRRALACRACATVIRASKGAG